MNLRINNRKTVELNEFLIIFWKFYLCKEVVLVLRIGHKTWVLGNTTCILLRDPDYCNHNNKRIFDVLIPF